MVNSYGWGEEFKEEERKGQEVIKKTINALKEEKNSNASTMLKSLSFGIQFIQIPGCPEIGPLRFIL